MLTKEQIRRNMIDHRNMVTPDQIQILSDKIQANVMSIPNVIEAYTIFIYASIDNEVSTHKLIKQLLNRNKNVLVPKIFDAGRMKACSIKSFDDLSTGQSDIPQPQHVMEYDGCIDVILLPALAYTPNGDRLGRAGGYYDRFLTDRPDPLRIGLGFDFQIVETIPADHHDQAVHMIVTESQIIQCRR